MTTVYLAGPDVFEPDPVGRGRALKRLCAAHGLVGLYPIDNEIVSADDVPGAIRDANMAMIGACDAVVANMRPFRGPSMDPGTAYEMGVGAALGKLVVGYGAGPGSYVERVIAACGAAQDPDGVIRDRDGCSVEAFGMPLVDNLMMARGVAGQFIDLEQALAFVVERLRRPPVD